MQKYIRNTYKNGGHLGRHLGFLKTPQVYAKVHDSLIFQNLPIILIYDSLC